MLINAAAALMIAEKASDLREGVAIAGESIDSGAARESSKVSPASHPAHDTPRIGDWARLPFFKETWPAIEARLNAETRTILPPEPLRFAALSHTSPEATRVVILGQDPYPTPGHANGLAFSVAPDVALPKSLKNIFRELEDDTRSSPHYRRPDPLGQPRRASAQHSLSVPAHAAGAHAKLGWSILTQQVLARLSDSPRAFLLWGKHAQNHRKYITGADHLFIETAHPSPLSAYRGFLGSRPFSQINTWLEKNAKPQSTGPETPTI